MFLFNSLRSNGTHKKNIIFGPEDSIFIDFEYEYYKTNDNDVKKNLEKYLDLIEDYNIIIDYSMILTITYLSFYVDDILIYDTTNNTVITFYGYTHKRLFNDHDKLTNVNEMKLVMFIYIFIKIFCRELNLTWNIDLAVQTVRNKSYLKGSFNLKCITEYLLKINTEFIPHKFESEKTIDVIKYLKIQNNINPLKIDCSDLHYYFKNYDYNNLLILN